MSIGAEEIPETESYQSKVQPYQEGESAFRGGSEVRQFVQEKDC